MRHDRYGGPRWCLSSGGAQQELRIAKPELFNRLQSEALFEAGAALPDDVFDQ
jgi:cytochrome P450